MRSLIRHLFGATRLWLPAVLLVIVAVNQQWLARTDALSPWSGGGFGMFSSTDSPGSRHLHGFVQNEGIRREVAIPVDLADNVRRATTLPTRKRLGVLAAEIALRESGGTIRWDEIELQVWATDYDPDSLLPTGRLLRKERFEIGTP